MKSALMTLLVLAIVAVATVGAALVSVVNRGISTKTEPTWAETEIAGAVRHLAIPRADRARANPVPASSDTIEAGLEHFADHCAVCHSNDGSGDTEIGRNLYPRAPDMRLPGTQSLSDGELFAIIENGVRLTGMPAWSTGTPEGEQASWHLVHFIRRLPKLTLEELEKMRSLNPKSAEEWREEEETRRFLEGGETQDAPRAVPERHRHGGGPQ